MKVANKKKKTKKFAFTGRSMLKVVSLIFAFVIWFYVLNKTHISIEKSIPIDINVPKGMSLLSSDTKEITYVLEGPRAFMRSLLDRDERITIDLDDYKPNKKNYYEVPIKTTGMTLPFGVDILKIIPSKVMIKIEATDTKKVPLRTNFIGNVSGDYKLIDFQLTPDKVTIFGAKSTVSKINEVLVSPIDLSELSGNGEINLGVSGLASGIGVKNGTPIVFQYKIRPKRANMNLKEVAIRFLTSTKIIRVGSRKVSLDLLADEDVLDSSKIEVIADIPDDSKGRVDVKLRVNLPDGVELLSIRPEKVTVFVR